MAGTAATSFAGQSVVGQHVTSAWVPGSWEITQGWGQTDYSGEPEGHGFVHWHAGVDLGCSCGTELRVPAGFSGTAKWLDNPGGYGIALTLQLDAAQLLGLPAAPGVDVILGHLRARNVADGAPFRPGDLLGWTNNTGNSSGCHLHFEVRPRGGKYGSDVDPTNWIIGQGGAVPTSGTTGQPVSLNPLDPLATGINQAVQQGISMGQVALGGLMVTGGLVAAGFGLGGTTPQQFAGRLRGAVSSQPPKRAAAKPQPEPTSAAAQSRLRPSLRSEAPASAPPRQPKPKARQVRVGGKYYTEGTNSYLTARLKQGQMQRHRRRVHEDFQAMVKRSRADAPALSEIPF